MAAKWLTEAEVRARFGDARITRFADRNGDGSSDTGVVDSAIERAESMVEAKLLTRYAPGDLPTETAEASLLLKEIVGGFFLWCITDYGDFRGEEMVLGFRSAERRLEDVCKGTSSLLLAGNPAIDNTAPQIVSSAGSAYATDTSLADGSRGIFTQESLRGF
jgi:phage gp36-like protein